MAVYWTRTAEMVFGKEAQAIEWAIRVMKYLNNTYRAEEPGEVLTNVGANMAEIHWVRKFESLAAMEKVSSKMDADEKLQALVKEMVDGGFLRATSDRLYQVHL